MTSEEMFVQYNEVERMDKKLTNKQKRVLDALVELLSEGIMPTYRDLQEKLGLRSIATVYDYVKRLERLGYVKTEGKARSIKIVAPVMNKFPLVGAVHAGDPTIAVEDIQGFLPFPVDPRLHPHAFVLKVKGDSMIEAHIEDGDLVIVDPDSPVSIGDICVAIIGDEATVKKVEKMKDGLYLVPANPKYKPIFITRDVKIIGKVIGLYRGISK
ncbi:MAG: repressor LexA [Caldisericum exile]|uniref:Repressor LexA n=1 Tax=Caldisericum exile TaxID=693075 RepID=A0A2J6X761_9BACT|nr:MAG: repressor LexA [Caldisericum exile]